MRDFPPNHISSQPKQPNTANRTVSQAGYIDSTSHRVEHASPQQTRHTWAPESWLPFDCQHPGASLGAPEEPPSKSRKKAVFTWQCHKCGKSTIGIKMERCPGCGHDRCTNCKLQKITQ